MPFRIEVVRRLGPGQNFIDPTFFFFQKGLSLFLTQAVIQTLSFSFLHLVC